MDDANNIAPVIATLLWEEVNRLARGQIGMKQFSETQRVLQNLAQERGLAEEVKASIRTLAAESRAA